MPSAGPCSPGRDYVASRLSELLLYGKPFPRDIPTQKNRDSIIKPVYTRSANRAGTPFSPSISSIIRNACVLIVSRRRKRGYH